MRELRKVIERSDVIIQVLDSRDPEGTRSRWVEEEVRKREMDGKKLLAVMNKIGTSLSCSARLGLIDRSGTPGKFGSVDETPPTFLPRHAIQIVYSITTPQPIAERCSYCYSTINTPSRASSPFSARSTDHLIITRCTSATAFAQTVRPVYAALVSYSRSGRVPKRR
jgi:hypothetical protein